MPTAEQQHLQSHIASVWWRATELDVVSGAGSYVTATDGKHYLDFTSGIAVASTGHCHPQVVAAITEQAARFIHAQVNVYRHPLLEELGRRLHDLSPTHIDTFFFANSGAEAVEAAVKLSRWATGRPNLIVFRGGFHGRTGQTMAMSSSKVTYRAGHGPLPAGVYVADYPKVGGTQEGAAEAGLAALQGVRELFQTQTAPGETAAIVVESILGEGGYFVPPRDFLRGLSQIAREHGVLLVLDEIQSGCGRTGRFLALEHFDVEPDIVIMGKGIGSGFPIAGIGARRELMSKWPPGSHGGTYGGNPIGCAAVLATLDVLETEGLLDNATVQGAFLKNQLVELKRTSPIVADVRGIGLMLAVDISEKNGEPSGALAELIMRYAREDGRLLLLACGTQNNVIRVIPPLNVSRAECEEAVAALAGAIERAAEEA
jgi:4-aminobutyrate aminotransferase